MKYVVLAIAALLSACSYQEIQQSQNIWAAPSPWSPSPDAKTVRVLGRTWTVEPVADQTLVYVAQRDNLDLNPYGAPAVRRSPQAVRAIEQTTGCRVVRSSLVQDSSARFFAAVTCP